MDFILNRIIKILNLKNYKFFFFSAIIKKMAIASSNLTSGFIDLATYDELDKYMYGGDESIAYFVRATQRSTWFTCIAFRSKWSSRIWTRFFCYHSRAGISINIWLRVTIPELSVALQETKSIKKTFKKRWYYRIVQIKRSFIAWTPILCITLFVKQTRYFQ